MHWQRERLIVDSHGIDRAISACASSRQMKTEEASRSPPEPRLQRRRPGFDARAGLSPGVGGVGGAVLLVG